MNGRNIEGLYNKRLNTN